MIRGLLIAFSLVWTARAFAIVTADRFVWERSGRFFLSIGAEGSRFDLRGNVRLGEAGDARQGAIAAQVKSYAGAGGSPVISAIITNDGTDVAHIVLIQADGEGDTKKILTPIAIQDRKASAGRDLDFIVNGLKARKNWDALAAFKWIASAGTGKQLFQLADRVEVATDAELSLPRPESRVAEGQGRTVRTPEIPQGARGMDPSVLDSPQLPPNGNRTGRQTPVEDDSMFSDDPSAPQNILPPGQGQPQPRYPRPQYGDNYGRGYPRQYGDGSYPNQYGDGMYPPPPEMQGQRGYPQQQPQTQPRSYPNQQRQQGQQRYPRGYANNGGFPPPPPFGGGNGPGFFERLFGN